VRRVIPFPAVSSAFAGVSLHDAVALARRRHRRLVTAAAQWAMPRGLSLPPDHVALWAAVAYEHGAPGDVDSVTGPWSVTELHRLVCSAVPDWCAEAGCVLPPGLAESLSNLYRFLAESGRLHGKSDSLDTLNTVLLAASALNELLPTTTRPPSPTAA
jgi:hypothetical protein